MNFDGFSLPADAFTDLAGLAAGPATISIRPQSHDVGSAGASPVGTAWAARVVQRAYLGEGWGYTVQPEGATNTTASIDTPLLTFELGRRSGLVSIQRRWRWSVEVAQPSGCR